MTGGLTGGAAAIAFTTRPTGGTLLLAALVALAGWALLTRAIVMSRPPIPQPMGDRRPTTDGGPPAEPPAVVALLTNGYEVPPTAVTATVLDLAARRWVRLAVAEDELVIFTRGHGHDGDALRPFEQQVLNHLTARSFDGVTSAGTIAASQDHLDRGWWRRFRADVARTARELGYTRPRFGPELLVPPLVAGALAGLLVWLAWRNGDDSEAIRDSLGPRLAWLAVLLMAAGLVVQCVSLARRTCERPTGTGEARAAQWLGYRARLLAKVPDRASVIAPPEHQLALAHAFVMGVADHVGDQLPAAPEDARLAWSDAGGTPHVVRVRYPMRPGYGRHPVVVAGVGLVVLLASVWARGFFVRVSDGEALEGLVDNFPDQVDLIERIASIVAAVMFVPMVWAVWAVAAGIVDAVSTRERTGLVVRTRRPSSVVPFRRLFGRVAERDRFAVFLAVDDGRRRSVTAWLASERTAAPQGAYARVRATPVLGYVRSSEPVGISTRRPEP